MSHELIPVCDKVAFNYSLISLLLSKFAVYII